MIIAYDKYGQTLGYYDNIREIKEDYPDDVIEVHDGKAIVKEEK